MAVTVLRICGVSPVVIPFESDHSESLTDEYYFNHLVPIANVLNKSRYFFFFSLRIIKTLREWSSSSSTPMPLILTGNPQQFQTRPQQPPLRHRLPSFPSTHHQRIAGVPVSSIEQSNFNRHGGEKPIQPRAPFTSPASAIRPGPVTVPSAPRYLYPQSQTQSHIFLASILENLENLTICPTGPSWLAIISAPRQIS